MIFGLEYEIYIRIKKMYVLLMYLKYSFKVQTKFNNYILSNK